MSVTLKGDKAEKNSSSSQIIKTSNELLLNNEKSQSWLSLKTARLCTLYKTSSYIWKSQGGLTFIRNLSRFLLGKRNNTKILSEGVLEKTKTDAELYEQWLKYNSLNHQTLVEQKRIQQTLSYRPLISVLTPVFNTDKEMLEKMIKSVIAQTYSNWELCLVDGASTNPDTRLALDTFSQRDSRIRVNYLSQNLGISGNSNEGIKMANGEFIALLDHDDELTPDALYENVLLLNKTPNADLIYSDEDKLDLKGIRCDPHFKPDWSPDLFYSMMYTCHLGVYRKSLVEKIGGFRKDFDGAQDYDLVLRLIEQTNEIHHIPKVLYHWRKVKGSTSINIDNKNYAKEAQIKAVAEHFQRLNVPVEVSEGLASNLLRVKRILSISPKVSIIIPTRDQVSLLQNCINSILQKTLYKNFEIIIVDNGSTEPDTLQYLKEVSKERKAKVLEYNFPFNFAAINNFAVKEAKGEILLFLNNDTEIISGEWLEAMIEHAVRPEVGVVGARLLYSNNTVQHAGVIIGIGGVAGHSHKNLPDNHPGYFSRAKAIQNLSAVTGACMMVRKEIFEVLGGFNEKDLPVAFNDIDFCLRVRQKGLLIIYTPYAELYHHESISRGADEVPEKALRFQREAEYMINHWADILQNDPYYNISLTLVREDFSIIDLKI